LVIQTKIGFCQNPDQEYGQKNADTVSGNLGDKQVSRLAEHWVVLLVMKIADVDCTRTVLACPEARNRYPRHANIDAGSTGIE